MKPNFALKLSHDGIEILQRTPTGWVLTGSTRFDVADLDGTLKQLRDKAAKLAPEGLYSKLILPESEVRYATVMAPGPTDEARRHQIEAEIERLTPYALHELAYDYMVEGDHALVAICAREIMAEAEDFAQTHGFNPVSFASAPVAGRFIGEPFLGETSCARAFLARGARVERDSEPVRLASQPKPSAPIVPSAVAPQSKAAPVAPAASATAPGSTPAGRAAAPATAAAPDAFSRVGNLVRRMGTRIRREQVQAEQKSAPPVPPPSKPLAAPTGLPPQAPAAPASASTPTSTPASIPASAPTAPPPRPGPSPAVRDAGAASGKGASVTPPSAPPPSAPRSTPPETNVPRRAQPWPTNPEPAGTQTAGGKPAGAEGATSEPKSSGAALAFSSRRKAPATTGPAPAPTLAASGPGARADRPNPGGRLAVLPAGDGKTGPGRMTRLYRRSRRLAKGALSRIGLLRASAGKAAANGGQGQRRRKARDEQAQQPLVPASRPPTDERAKATEAESLTIFGARNLKQGESSFARRGLMLTGGLLLLLVAVAVWAVYFTNQSGRDAEIALVPQDTASLPRIEPPARLVTPDPAPPAQDGIAPPAPVAPAQLEAVAPEAVAEATDAPALTEAEAAALDSPAPADTGTETTAPVTDPEALLEELVQEALSEAMPLDQLGQADETAVEPLAGLPRTGAEPPAETAFDTAETPQITAGSETEPAQQLGLPQRLDQPQLAEVAPVSPPPPPPFGTEFTLGADGLVEATPEGALTPQGVMVYAGRPSTEVPPVRPAGLAPEPPAPAEEAPAEEAPEPEAAAPPADQTDAAAVIMDDTPRADPALAAARPQPRSPRVAEMAAQRTETPEAEPDGATDTDTAPEAADPNDDSSALTPPPGGVSLDGLRPQRRPTDLVPPAAEATATAEAVEDDTAPEAVAVSLRPSARPSDMSARIQQALAAARSPEPAAAAAPAPAAPAPAQTAAAAPNIPTSASVAQQATQSRAINLRRVNLIGVFGTPNDRRALVRLSNGQVIRVQVGDTLDGGRVSAIGDDELRYIKNGRNEVLRIGSSG